MTERKKRRPAALPTVLVALALFAVAFEFLAFQLDAGRDPGLADTPASPGPAKAKPRKKIIITRVIPASGSAGGATASSSSSGATAAPAPVSTSSS